MTQSETERLWLALAVALAACIPARAMLRRRPAARSHNWFERPTPQQDRAVATRRHRDLIWLILLAGLAALLLAPEAGALARSPGTLPQLIPLAIGVYALFTVLKGAARNEVRPLVQGLSSRFREDGQPGRYWASMAWNMAVGIGGIWIGWNGFSQAARQAAENRCLATTPPEASLAACETLLARHDRTGAELASIIEARGSARYRLGDYRDAREDYGAAIRLDPKEPTSRYDLGLIDEMPGTDAAAIADYGAAIALKPDYADAYLKRAGRELARFQLDAAIGDCDRAVLLAPRNALAYALRGLAYTWQDRPDRARGDFAVARGLDPANFLLLHGEALLAADSGDLDVALARLDQALRLDPDDSWALWLRAKIYRQLRQPARSDADLSAMRRVLARAPGRS